MRDSTFTSGSRAPGLQPWAQHHESHLVGAHHTHRHPLLARQQQRLVHVFKLLVKGLHLQTDASTGFGQPLHARSAGPRCRHAPTPASAWCRTVQCKSDTPSGSTQGHGISCSRTLLVRLLPLRSRPPLPVYRNHSPSSLSSSYLQPDSLSRGNASLEGQVACPNTRPHAPYKPALHVYFLTSQSTSLQTPGALPACAALHAAVQLLQHRLHPRHWRQVGLRGSASCLTAEPPACARSWLLPNSLLKQPEVLVRHSCAGASPSRQNHGLGTHA